MPNPRTVALSAALLGGIAVVMEKPQINFLKSVPFERCSLGSYSKGNSYAMHASSRS